MNNNQIDELTKPAGKPGQLKANQVNAWLQEISTRKSKEKDWRNEAKKIIALYEGYKREASPFNILYSNTDTLSPALYNNTPRPSVGKRYKDKDPLAGAVALTLTRTLSFTMDTNNAAEEAFDKLVQTTILGALVPGRGVVRWRYTADFEAQKETQQSVLEIKNAPAEGGSLQNNSVEVQSSNSVGEQDIPAMLGERVCGEVVAYDRFVMGFAHRWVQVPWVSFEYHMTKEELEENFGKEVAKLVKVAELEEDASDETKAAKDTRKVAVVYELWDKTSKKVMFISPGLPERELRIVDDPLKLSGFFPCTEPLSFLQKLSSQVPQPIYNLYREQAEELNQTTRRITGLLNALKVRGAYDSTVTDMAGILAADDNTLLPIENINALGDGRGLKDAIHFIPLGEISSVLQQLYVQRTQIKQVIYEITGISDILRGSSVASESATAQNIKNQWGTLRLKSMQKQVSLWCRDNLRVIAEIAGQKFSQETFIQMTGLPYVTAEQKGQAQQQLQQMQQQQQQQTQLAQQQGQQPPPPQQPPEELTSVLATPVWEEIIQMMRSDTMSEFRIDIETNSTIADDMAEDQKNIGELLNALSQFLNGVAPLIENGAMPFEVAKTMMLGIVRKMAMGPEIEEQLEKMQEPKKPEAEAPPAPPPPDPNTELKAKAEGEKLNMGMHKLQQEAQIAQQQGQLELEKLKLENEKLQLEMQLAKEELNNKLLVEQEKRQVSQEKFKQQMMLAQQKTMNVGFSQGGNDASL